MKTEHLMHWFSAGKPFAVVALGQLWERGLCGLDDPVAQHLPEFAQHGKEAITLRHVLTHTGGFRSRVDLDWSAVNGMPGEEVHHRRFLELLTTVYEELGLA